MKVVERMRDLALYHAMLAWYTMANRPGSSKEQLMADQHFRQRAQLTFFYHWMVYLKHKALTVSAIASRIL